MVIFFAFTCLATMFSSKLLTEIIENDFLIRTRPHRVRHPYHTDFSSALVRTVAQVEMH